MKNEKGLSSSGSLSTIIVGAGPAGLTAAYELARRGQNSLVIEQSDKVGGISRTETYKGYRFDIGGHRFFTKVPEVNALWQEVMGPEMLKVPRLSRIFYNQKFFDYPLSIGNTLGNLGPYESLRILLSYLQAQLRPSQKEETFEEWVINRFGRRLYLTFFKTYTEKVWGIPCDQIRADWAAQRIKGLSLSTAVKNALLGSGDVKTLIKEFDYPKYGPGEMWERFTDRILSLGSEVRLNTRTRRFVRKGNRIEGVVIQDTNGLETTLTASQFLSSAPVQDLLLHMDPLPPEEVVAAAKGLKYRDFMIVPLIVKRDNLFPDNWIYIHSPEVRVGRIQNFKNWSAAMVPDTGYSCLGMEYFCNADDVLWNTSDGELIAMASAELEKINLASADDVMDGTVIRQRHAYPVYDEHYRGHLDVIKSWVTSLENLQTVGRNGLHRYNNQDHSMLSAILAVRNLYGEKHDLWEVNTERSYHEDFVHPKKANASTKPLLEAVAS